MIKINVKVKNTPRLDGFKKELLTKQFLSELARNITQIIRKRVKAGGGVSSEETEPEQTKRQKLAPLSPNYIKKRTKNRGTLGEFASARKSNLTYTGQMLDAIVWRVDGKKLIISINDKLRRDGRLTNADVAFYASKTRPFFNLTDSEYRIVVFQVKKHINALTRKYFG